MGLGINTAPSASGDFLPIVKYDARAGRVARVDRVNDGSGWTSNNVDITQNFSAVFDLANIQTGWISYTPPSFMVGPIGRDMGPKPGEKFSEGFRMTVKLSKECGGDLRDLSSTAKATVGAVSLLHDDYLAGLAANPGMLPVVEIATVTAVTSGSGDKKSTNYAPTFKITRWVKRPADLLAPAPTSKVDAAPAPRGPAATGSTKVSPPAPSHALSAQDASDFG